MIREIPEWKCDCRNDCQFKAIADETLKDVIQSYGFFTHTKKEEQEKSYCVLHAPVDATRDDNKTKTQILEGKEQDLIKRIKEYYENKEQFINFVRVVFSEIANFSKAIFTQEANFNRATFTQNAYFSEATFTQIAHFYEATFTQIADFYNATFTQIANFSEATFTQIAHFYKATFTQIANFSKATFTQKANFSKATFTQIAHFYEATFTQEADFSEATFGAEVKPIEKDKQPTEKEVKPIEKCIQRQEFKQTIFLGTVHFNRAEFHNGALFNEVNFNSKERPVYFTGLNNFNGDLIFKKISISNCSVIHVSFLKKIEEGNNNIQSIIFDRSTFRCNFMLEQAEVKRTIIFYHTSFKESPKLISLTLAEPPIIYGCTIPDDFNIGDVTIKNKNIENKTWDETEIAKRHIISVEEIKRSSYRNLKRFFGLQREKGTEADYFEKEMDCITKQIETMETSNKQEEVLRCTKCFFLGRYKAISDYGNSIGKPLLYLVCWFVYFAIVYYYLGYQSLWKLAVKNTLIPFCIIRTQDFNCFGFWLSLTSMLHSLISITLIFLTLLAIKRKLSMK